MPINRLFWKFFIYLWLAQFATMSGLNAYFWYRYAQMNSEYQTQQLAIAVEGDTQKSLTPLKFESNEASESRQSGAHRHSEAPRKPRSIFPVRPLITGTIASAIFAALLAWSFSRPITQLRNALNLAANGNLDVRIGESMKKRNDELGDLGTEFDRMSSQLQQLISSQRTLLHDVSHEMRSPLARIQAIIGLIDQKPQQQTELLEKLNRESQRIDRLLAELLTMARLDAGLIQPEKQLIDIKELLTTLLEDASPQAEIANISLMNQFKSLHSVYLSGDGDMLYRALDNLIRNALKFTPAHGEIILAANCDGTHIDIIITDSGPGVPEQDLPFITNPFFRSQHAKPVNGHGLGLAIAKRMIQAHKGQFLIKNRQDGKQGLTIAIRLNQSSNSHFSGNNSSNA